MRRDLKKTVICHLSSTLLRLFERIRAVCAENRLNWKGKIWDCPEIFVLLHRRKTGASRTLPAGGIFYQARENLRPARRAKKGRKKPSGHMGSAS